MSEPIAFLRRTTEAPSSEFERIVTAAVLRDAEERIARGERLVDGHWQLRSVVRDFRADKARATRRSAYEMLALWSLVGLLGLAFAALAALLV